MMNDVDDEELVAVAGVASAAVANTATATDRTAACYKWAKPAEIFLGAPDEKLVVIVNQAIAERFMKKKNEE